MRVFKHIVDDATIYRIAEKKANAILNSSNLVKVKKLTSPAETYFGKVESLLKLEDKPDDTKSVKELPDIPKNASISNMIRMYAEGLKEKE